MFSQWEKDLDHSYSATQWERALQSIYKATTCSSLWEHTQSITQHRYLTPLKIATFDHKVPPVCWRNCITTGSLFHILWECPLFTPFWMEVHTLISQITEIATPPSPDLALLNLNIENIPYKFLKTITHILLASRQNVTKRWKLHLPPMVLGVIKQVQDHYIFETTLEANRHTLPKLFQAWEPWSTWYSAHIKS